MSFSMLSLQSSLTAFSTHSYEDDCSTPSTPSSTYPSTRSNSLTAIPEVVFPISVTKMFEGSKTFSRDHIKAQLFIFEHKQFSPTAPSPCLEIASYVDKYLDISVPRLFLSADQIYSRFKNKRHAKGSRYAQESTVSYIFGRFSITNRSPNSDSVSFHVEMENRDDDVATDSGLEEGCNTDFEGEMFLGPLPHIDHISYPPGDPREMNLSAVEIEWQRKLKLFRNDHSEFTGAVRKASLLSTSTTSAIATFLKRPVDRYCEKIAVRRWQKAIHRVVLQNHVKKMTSRLEEIHLERMAIVTQFSQDVVTVSLQGCSTDDDEDNGPKRSGAVMIKLPSLLKVSRGRPSLHSLFSGNPLHENGGDPGLFSPFSPTMSTLDRPSRKYSDPQSPNVAAVNTRRRSLNTAQSMRNLTRVKSGIVVPLQREASTSNIPSTAKSLIIPPATPFTEALMSPRPLSKKPMSPMSPRPLSETVVSLSLGDKITTPRPLSEKIISSRFSSSSPHDSPIESNVACDSASDKAFMRIKLKLPSLRIPVDNNEV